MKYLICSFSIQLLISDPPHIASRLGFDCAPKGKFLGLAIDGRKISLHRECVL